MESGSLAPRFLPRHSQDRQRPGDASGQHARSGRPSRSRSVHGAADSHIHVSPVRTAPETTRRTMIRAGMSHRRARTPSRGERPPGRRRHRPTTGTSHRPNGPQPMAQASRNRFGASRQRPLRGLRASPSHPASYWRILHHAGLLARQYPRRQAGPCPCHGRSMAAECNREVVTRCGDCTPWRMGWAMWTA